MTLVNRNIRAAWRYLLILTVAAILSPFNLQAQEHSIAREWNEVLLESIREDFARPTVHARNLWHSSTMMYDIWAVYYQQGDTYFLGKTVGDYTFEFEGIPVPDDVDAATHEAISYAMYRLINHRFANAPGIADIFEMVTEKMIELGYSPAVTSTEYQDGNPAHFGNWIAQEVINFGFTDNSNELSGFTNNYYLPTNEPLDMGSSGNPDVVDPNRWQPLVVDGAVDQAGNPVEPILDFLSPEWGEVVSFSLTDDDLTEYERDGETWRVYKDPGAPPYLEEGLGEGLESLWKWGHVLVAVWQGHHDATDGVTWDISPNNIGNNPELPTTFEEYENFYNFNDGGDASQGYDVNPVTGMPYEEQIVPRADYARILAEFWADGPDSETPPGHWYTILHEVSDHPLINKRWAGQGPILSDLEWDVKTYFVLGATMHDAAICAWSVKGYYDYGRPVSAIRHMAEMGQCSDVGLPNYHPDGFPLIPGKVELVLDGDPLAGDMNENLNEIKLFTWRGPDYIDTIENEEGETVGINEAGVGWILAKDWWPYQRPTFVTPPFAGYVSGHSTYSRAAAEVFTLFTGDEYFPGGKSGFEAPQNEFLVFEEGPSTDVVLEWATYRDASDQCSLSRIWGGIHPPADDIPGRLIGKELGPQVYAEAITYFENPSPRVESVIINDDVITDADELTSVQIEVIFDQNMDMMSTPILDMVYNDPIGTVLTPGASGWMDANRYAWNFQVNDLNVDMDFIFAEITGALNTEGFLQVPHVEEQLFIVDQVNPQIQTEPSYALINDAIAEAGTVSYVFEFSEAMDTESTPFVTWQGGNPDGTLVENTMMSQWVDATHYELVFDVLDANADFNLNLELTQAKDAVGNFMSSYAAIEELIIDTNNPNATLYEASAALINEDVVGGGTFTLTVTYDQVMDMAFLPEAVFPNADLSSTLILDEMNSGWDVEGMVYTFVYTLADADVTLPNIEFETISAVDASGNVQNILSGEIVFEVDTENPSLIGATPDSDVISDSEAGTGGLVINLEFSEEMDMAVDPMIAFNEDLSASLTLNTTESMWVDATNYSAVYDVADDNVEIEDLTIAVTGTVDANNNPQGAIDVDADFVIDTKNPEVLFLSANDYFVTPDDEGEGNFSIIAIFDEDMNTDLDPIVLFPAENPGDALTENAGLSGWLNSTTYEAAFDVAGDESNVEEMDVDVIISSAIDPVGNLLVQAEYADYFDIDMNPVGLEEFLAGDFALFPNPVLSGQALNMRSSELEAIDHVSIHDVNGRILFNMETIPAGQQVISLPTENLAGGMYLLKIQVNGESKSIRFQIIG